MHRAFALAGALLVASPLACKSSSSHEAKSQPTPSPPTGSHPGKDGGGQPVETGPDDVGAKPATTGTDVATGSGGAVTSAEKSATSVGISILKKGGNAVDAAVAVGLALSVTHPSAGNIGGGGFMVIYFPDGRSTTIDYREMAPGKATRDMYLDKAGNPTEDSRRGPRAAGIPGDVAGFAMAHRKYGSLPWKDVVMPAVELARAGHPLDHFHAEDLAWAGREIDKYIGELEAAPGGDKKRAALIAALKETAALFRKPDGSGFKAGDTWTEPALAGTLEAIAADGADAFYRGPLARKMADEVQKMGGIWTAADLSSYAPIERKPIVFDYRGNTIITMPPPSAGGITLRQILGASEVLGLDKLDWDSVDRIHLYVEALRRVYADRTQLVADPAFVKVPLETLLDVKYLTRRMSDIEKDRATPSKQVGAGVELVEKPETTHFSVVDGKGMAVANTFTLNGGFGARVAVPGTGVVMNDEMDDFTAKVGAPNMYGLVQGPQNAIAPKKRMLSSMTPTVVTRGGKLRLVCGSPGGPTISTTVAQVVLQVIDHDRPLDQAIAATRIHHQWLPDVIMYEESLDKATVKALEARGHKLTSRGRIGHANCIEVDAKTGALRAVADTGRDGGDADAY